MTSNPSCALRIMTFNIRLGIQQGVDAIAAVIQRAAPDVVALQEVGRHWTMGPSGDTAQEIADILGWEHVVYVNTIKRDDHCYGHALLSRIPLEVTQQVALPQNRDEPRALLQVQLKQAPYPVLLSTHLSHLDDERPPQVEELVKHAHTAAQAGHPVLVMGDLNAHHDAAWIQHLSADFHDADADLARLTFPSHAPRVRIDYLFTHGGTWSDVEVLEDDQASDHFGLFATWTPNM